MSRRVDRINGLLREEISSLLIREIKDPRLNALLTITHVRTSSDLRNAKVYLSVLGNHEDNVNALQGIRSAATFLRKTESRPEQAGIDMSMYPDREEAAFSGLPSTDITPTKAIEKLNAKLMP